VELKRALKWPVTSGHICSGPNGFHKKMKLPLDWEINALLSQNI